ncbi:MAG TPA: hypothetical protein VGR73_07345 [Bryobacteraceae bacterium]|nr:hypothetical protein [Bryobacteraceae bacterium]
MLASLANPYPAIDNPPAKFWLWPNLLSLDAPFVAVLWQILFIRCFHVSADALPAILLVASVWLIYAADRALDAWRGECGSPRHRFYRAHWRILLPVWMAVLAASAWLALAGLPEALLRRGLALLAAVVVYLALVHGWKGSMGRLWSKEAIVGLLFALGASLAAWTNVRTPADAAAIALFFVLCWINCAAIQKWEAGACTFSLDWPAGALPVRSAAIAVALVSMMLLWMHRPALGGAEMASAFAFVFLDRSGRRFSPDALRVLADVALLSPLVFLPLAKTIS